MRACPHPHPRARTPMHPIENNTHTSTTPPPPNNPSHPITHAHTGEVHSLKLSPNLRDQHEPRDELGNVLPHDAARLQFNTAERILQALLAAAEAGEGGGGQQGGKGRGGVGGVGGKK
jgi:hypothetical protein